MKIRIHINSKCATISDLGLGSDAQKAEGELLYLIVEVKRLLDKAQLAHNIDDETSKHERLREFFWSPGSENALDKKINEGIDRLRAILLGIARIQN
jgi:hypothetical protein